MIGDECPIRLKQALHVLASVTRNRRCRYKNLYLFGALRLTSLVDSLKHQVLTWTRHTCLKPPCSKNGDAWYWGQPFVPKDSLFPSETALEDFVTSQLSEPLSAFTNGTVTDPAVLRDRLRRFRQQGYSLSEGGVDSDVISVATPFFDAGAMPAGTIAIQAPAARMTDAIARTGGALLCAVARQATQHYGGVLPADFPALHSPNHLLIETFSPETHSQVPVPRHR